MSEIPAAKPISEPDAAKPFIGSWKLISFEVTSTSGTVRKPFGDHPIGLLLYQRNGHMSAQLMQPDPTPFASADPGQAREDEIDGA